MSVLWFVFSILVLIFLKGCHARYLEYRLKRQFLDDSLNDIQSASENDEFFKLGGDSDEIWRKK